MTKKIIFSKMILLLLIAFLSWSFLIFSTSAEPNSESANVRLAVHVSDIDQSQKLATVDVVVFIDNFPDNRTEVQVRIVGGGSIIVSCKNTGSGVNGWYYQGESDQTTWLLQGTGEIFPFDSYRLRFNVYDIPLIQGNFSLSSKYTSAFFVEPKAYSLNDLWLIDKGFLPIDYIGTNEVSFIIQKVIERKGMMYLL